VDLKQLQYFVHVAELGSFTRAATFLSVVQPALSRQIRTLELELRQNLFDRNGRGVVLTEPGKRLLEHARGILQQIERARQDLDDQREVAAGHIVLGLPPSLGRCVTVPIVTAFRQRLPKATLATVEGLSSYILEWLSIGRVDCALVYNATPAAHIELLPVFDERLYLISPVATGRGRAVAATVTLAGIADYALVIPSRPHAMRMSVENALAKVGRKIQVAHEVECVPAIIDLVRQGHGHAVLPMNAVRSSSQTDAIICRPILRPTLTASLWLATSAPRPKGPLMQQAIELVRDVVRRELDDAERESAGPRQARAERRRRPDAADGAVRGAPETGARDTLRRRYEITA
jgi:LysR family transcriptional regulator, nitrogen assimilation regulatory protein